MLALYRSGRQSEALEAYRQARSALVEEIGVEPGAELRRLQDAILAQDPALDLPASTDAAPRAPPAGRRRGGALVLVVAAVLVVAGVTAYGVIRVLRGRRDAHRRERGRADRPGERADHGAVRGRPEPGRDDGRRRLRVGRQPARRHRVADRPRAPTRSSTIPVGGAPSALAFGAGSLWVADGDGREVAQVDPGANKVVQRIEVGNAPRVARGRRGALWAVSGVDGSVQRIDLDRRTARLIPIGAIPTAIVAGAGALWVASEESGTVTRIDPRSGAVVFDRGGQRAERLAAGEGAVWVVNRQDGTLSRIDPERNAVSGSRRSAATHRGRGRRREPSGWPAARTGPSRAWTPDGPR